MTPEKQHERVLHDEISISKAMDFSVSNYNGTCLQLTAPLIPNINHKCTAFGGSLYSVAVLCGWGLLYLKLAEAGLHKHIVIQEANIQYLLPVDQDIVSECRIEEASFKKFMITLKKRERARLSLDVCLKQNNHVTVEFSGRYVVHG
jgi:thioesterase domain-containing protein